MKRLLPALLAFAVGFAIAGYRGMIGETPPAALAGQDVGLQVQSGESNADDPLSSAIAAAQSIGPRATLHAFAELGARLEQLNAEQIGSLLGFLERQPRHDYRDLECAFSWWLEHDPEAASRWLQPRLKRFAQNGPLGMSFDLNEGVITQAWTRKFPKEAIAFAREHAHTGLAAKLIEHALRISEKDPAKRFIVARDFPQGAARQQALEQTLNDWARKDGNAALAAAKAIDGFDPSDAMRIVLENWPEKDARAAFDHYRALGLSDPELLAKILRKSSLHDPQTAIAWLAELDPTQVARVAPEIVDAWAAKEPVAALRWALENGVQISMRHSDFRMKTYHNGFGRQGTFSGGDSTAPLSTAMKKDGEATVAWIQSLPQGWDRTRLAELALPFANADQKLALFPDLPAEAQQRVASMVATSLEGKSRSWAETLPPGPVRENAWRGVGAVSREAIDLPPGPERDAMLQGRSLPYGERRAEDSLKIVTQIQDPVRRRDAFDDVMEFYTEVGIGGGPAEARALMEKTDVPEEWKQPWRVPAVR